MQTLERVEKRNQAFYTGDNYEKSLLDREKFVVQLRKNSRNQCFMKQRWKDTTVRENDKEEIQEFNRNKRGYISKIVSEVKANLNDSEIVANGLMKLIKCFTSRVFVLDFWENDVFSLCMSIIDQSSSVKLLIYATDLLSNLTYCEESKCKVMVENGIIPKCLGLLDMHNKEITENCLWIFSNISIGSKDISLMLAADPTFAYLISLTTNQNLMTDSKLLEILISISKYTKKVEYHSNILIPIFIGALKHKKSFKFAIMGLECITINFTDNLHKIYSLCPEIIEIITKSEGNEEKILLLYCLKLLGNFAYSTDYIQVLLDKGVLPYLKKMMISYITWIRKEVFFILSNLLLSEDYHVGVIAADNELILRVLEGVNDIDYEVRLEVWHCIRVLVSKIPFIPFGFFDTLVFNMNLAFGKEIDPKILILMLESYEFMIKNAGEYEDTLKTLLESSKCFEKMSEKIYHGNKDVSNKASSLIEDFYDKYELRGSAPEIFEFS